MKYIFNKLKRAFSATSNFFTTLLLFFAVSDARAGGAAGWGAAAARVGGDIPAGTMAVLAIFGLLGVILTGMFVLGFFKKGAPVEVGKQIGLGFGGAVLLSLTWFISTTSATIAGSDQTGNIQTLLIQ